MGSFSKSVTSQIQDQPLSLFADVDISPPVTGEFLLYDSSTKLYSPARINGDSNITVNSGSGDINFSLADDVKINGNLTVVGNIDAYTRTELFIQDATILVASGAADSSAANGAGFKIDGTDASFLWSHANSRMELNKPLYVNNTVTTLNISALGAITGSVVSGSNIYGNAATIAGLVHISAESSTPSAPSDGAGGYLYAKTNGKVYWRSNELAETDLTEGRPAGADTQFQYNNGGNAFGAASSVVYNDSTGYVGMGVAADSATHRLTLPNTAGAAGRIKANAFVSYSSKRYKEDIKTIEEPIDTIMKLRGVTYKWKNSTKEDLGFIAEEVGTILPDIVDWETEGVDAYSMDYTRLVPILVEAVKEQQKKISSLENKLKSDRRSTKDGS